MVARRFIPKAPQVHRSVRGVQAPSIGDREALPRELKHLKPVERAPDKYDALYNERVAAGSIEHKTSKQRWREMELQKQIAELKKKIAQLETRAAEERHNPTSQPYRAICVRLQDCRYRLGKIEAGRPQ